MSRIINTVSAYRSLLQEEDDDLKELGIRRLLSHISLHWIDIANDINFIETLYEDPSFPNRPLVAFLLAKLYFYLNDYDEALKYALRSESEFDITNSRDEFTVILVNKCIEKFIESCRAEERSPEHEQYKTIVDFVVKNSLSQGEYRLPLGVALDTHDRDLFSRVLAVAEFNDFIESLLPHLLGLEVEFRKDILARVAERIPPNGLSPAQYMNLLQVLQVKGDYETVSQLIYELVKKGEKEVAYTLALEVSEIHGFNKRVLASIPIEAEYEAERKILADIIEGDFASNINNQVLKLHSRTDPHYLNSLKKIEGKYSIAHGAAILGLSMLQAFTQDDSFVTAKENLEWAAKSTHWNKLSSIASLGLINKNLRDRSVFSKFLP
jgi:26S proteasome regulatory subunit N2